jgi:hypothetical protein
MSQFYSNPVREDDEYALPDCEVFQLTAREVAEMDEDLVREYMKNYSFRLAGFNRHDRRTRHTRRLVLLVLLPWMSSRLVAFRTLQDASRGY